MKLETQAAVRMEDGTEVGRIARLVLDPKSKEVTHLILKKGVLPEDKVVPIGRVDAGTADGVIFEKVMRAELELLPPFEEKHYVETGEPEAPSAAAAGAVNLRLGPGFLHPGDLPAASGASERHAAVEVTRNIPDGAVALKAGASVVTADRRKVGRVEQLRTRPGTDEVSELVIAQGLLGRTRRRIPMQWVQRLTDLVVRLQVGSAMVDGANALRAPNSVRRGRRWRPHVSGLPRVAIFARDPPVGNRCRIRRAWAEPPPPGSHTKQMRNRSIPWTGFSLRSRGLRQARLLTTASTWTRPSRTTSGGPFFNTAFSPPGSPRQLTMISAGERSSFSV